MNPSPVAGDASLRMHNLHRRVYRFRTLGMGLGILPVMVVLLELEAGWPSWAWAAFAGLLWPHLAYLLAARSKDPFRAEIRNLMFDSMLAGSLASLMHFNLLPSALLMTVACADKINSGIRGLWLRSLPAMAAALLLTGLSTGFAAAFDTSMPVMLACMPLLVIHTLAVSASGYQLIRKVQKQNQRLDEISRHDSLTGLQNRGHWQDMANALLARHAAGHAASLMLVDVDEFKDINDRHGHAAGDDLLRGIAEAILQAIPEDSHAGRLGGDEFGVLLPLPAAQARAIAERIRVEVQSLVFPRAPAMRGSISIGLAEPPADAVAVRDWMEIADRALYRAKAAGRNRLHAAAEADLA